MIFDLRFTIYDLRFTIFEVEIEKAGLVIRVKQTTTWGHCEDGGRRNLMEAWVVLLNVLLHCI
ncbi:MAG: hypothetical protein ACOH2D_06680 [Gelidibacter sp.]